MSFANIKISIPCHTYKPSDIMSLKMHFSLHTFAHVAEYLYFYNKIHSDGIFHTYYTRGTDVPTADSSELAAA